MWVCAGGFAARHHPVIPLLSTRRGERRRQGDEEGIAQERDCEMYASSGFAPKLKSLFRGALPSASLRNAQQRTVQEVIELPQIPDVFAILDAHLTL